MVSVLYQKFYKVIRRIPRGRVTTYGTVARLAGLPRHARHVGYALHALPENSKVPWHRVINAQGKISARSDSIFEERQRQMLVQEGVVFGKSGAVSFRRFGWKV